MHAESTYRFKGIRTYSLERKKSAHGESDPGSEQTCTGLMLFTVKWPKQFSWTTNQVAYLPNWKIMFVKVHLPKSRVELEGRWRYRLLICSTGPHTQTVQSATTSRTVLVLKICFEWDQATLQMLRKAERKMRHNHLLFWTNVAVHLSMMPL